MRTCRAPTSTAPEWGSISRGPSSGTSSPLSTRAVSSPSPPRLNHTGRFQSPTSPYRKTGNPSSSPMRTASRCAASIACGISAGTSGTRGTTSATPTRGWTPTCSPRSISSVAAAMPASSASTSAPSSPTSVNTERWWSASEWTSRSSTPSANASPIAETTSGLLPSETLGTASSTIRTLRSRARRGATKHGGQRMAHVRAPPRLPAPVPRLAHRLVGARDPLPDHGRARSRADGCRHQRARRRPRYSDPGLRDRRDRRARARPRRPDVRAARHLGTAGARGRVRPPRRALLAFPPALVRFLRPQPDRPAHVARDDRPAVGALLPRLGLIFFAQHIVTIVVVTGVLFVYSWKLALIALAITPLIAATAYRYSHVSQPVLREVQQTLAEVAIVAEESITGVHVVKSFAQEDRRSEHFDAASNTVFERTVAANRQRALYVPLLTFLPLVAQALVLLAAGRMVVSGSLTLGAFATFNLLFAMLVMPLRMLGMWIGQAQRAIAAGRRIFEALDEPEEITDRPDALPLAPGPGRLVFEDVTFGYDPERPVLEVVALDVSAGRTIALVGPTGSGKTTLAALVPRFYDTDTGRVLVDGVDVRDLSRRSLRREIGVISQDPFLFSASIRDNIALGLPDAPFEAVEAAARAAEAHDFIFELPHGYDTVVGERGITLSGGQRQRIAIARALLIDPRILILDDATASVDATTEARIRSGLREVMRDRTTIIIAHRLSTIALADEIVVLDHGRIAARGTRSELLEESPLFREIHDHGLLQQVVSG